jgi:hypothetical protein
MQYLNKNWITENQIDFEYKKYVLLAYLQHVSENFTEYRLYPYLSDLVEHYRNLKSLKDNKQNLFNLFPERVKGADVEQFKLIYEKIIQDDSLMQEIVSILEFSIPQMEVYLREGKKIYDFIEDRLKISPVGLIPLNSESGYLLLKESSSVDTRVYEFQITIFENPVEKYRGIHLSYVKTYEKSIVNTFEAIKSDLIRYNRNLPNPATYVIETDMVIPFEETFLPLAKRTLVKRIAGTA